jgi:hypothetical protein
VAGTLVMPYMRDDTSSAQDQYMANVPYEASYGYNFGLMFSFRTRFMIKQLVQNSSCVRFLNVLFS